MLEYLVEVFSTGPGGAPTQERDEAAVRLVVPPVGRQDRDEVPVERTDERQVMPSGGAERATPEAE
jgi:hypothetical protein